MDARNAAWSKARFIALAIAMALLTGCVNPYAKFYQGQENARTLPNYIPSDAPLQIYSSNDLQHDVGSLIEQGYAVVGESRFQAPAHKASEGNLRAQAEQIGAQAVVISSQYSHNVSGAMPYSVPTQSTSYTTGSATAYGAGGVVNAYGNSTTTTYGTQTMLMPYSVAISRFDAVYLAKFKVRLGTQVVALDDETRQKLQSNFGVIVKHVVEGSPAFNANVLPGDIILSINQVPVSSPQAFSDLTKVYAGQTITLQLYRNGNEVEKQVSLPE